MTPSVGGDDDHDDVGDVGPAGPHLGERLVAGRVEEGDAPFFLDLLPSFSTTRA